MSKKPRSPGELAKTRQVKKTYSFSLIKSNVDAVVEMANAENIPVSEVVDEAIASYLDALKESKSK